MRAKSLVLLVVALGCGMIAAVAASKAVLDNGSGPKTEAMVEIFVAVKDLEQGQKISAEGVKLEKWPKSRLPEGALTNLDQLEDKFTNQVIFTSEPILERKVADSRDSFSTGIPQGYRIFDIQGSGGYIKPGDHVDIVGTFAIGGRNAVTESRTVMRNVKVHGINGIATRDSDEISNAKSTTFQLLVKESQLETLTLANSLGELRLNLRPFGEDGSEDSDNGESFLKWATKAEPEQPWKEIEVPTAINISDTETELAPVEKPKQYMTIVTPNGIQRYEWSDDDAFPKLVTPEEQAPLQSNGAGNTSGNVYSNYGGYKPTYPTSTSAPEAGAENPTTVNDAEPDEDSALQ